MAEFLDGYSYVAIIVTLVLTGCGLPVPEEVPIIAAGVGASLNRLDLTLAYASCMIGALLGDACMYCLGRFFGRRLLQTAWLSHWLSPENEARAELMIRKHGVKVFFLARFLVGVRAPMYISAGILRVPLARFVLIDAICASVVVSIVFGLSYKYGKHVEVIWSWIHESQIGLTLLLFVSLAGLGLYLLWRRHKGRKLEPGAAANDVERQEKNVVKEESNVVS